MASKLDETIDSFESDSLLPSLTLTLSVSFSRSLLIYIGPEYCN